MVMRFLEFLFFTVFLVAFLALCSSDALYRDISTSSPYRELIGQVCTVNVPLRAHGVTAKIEKDKKTDYVVVWEPGFTGPEVTFIESIQPGTVMRVAEARKCWNCPFDDLIDYRIDLTPSPPSFVGHPVFVRAELMSEKYVSCKAAK